MKSVTKVTKIVTDIILALLVIYSCFVAYNNWTDDTASNLGVVVAIAIVLGAAKIAQAIILMVTRGIDGIPNIFKS